MFHPVLRFTCLSIGLLLITLPTASAQLGLELSNAATNSPSVAIPHDLSLAPVTSLTIEAWMTFETQMIFSEPGCSVPMFASDGMTITIQ